MRPGVCIVKLGGSFAFSEELKPWLDPMAACAGRVVLVPGGGPFADAVRSAQEKIDFEDWAAHHMALLAMEQYGCALVSLCAGLRLAATPIAIRRALRAGEVPVWSPLRMVLAANDVPESWDVTADSLAAWLAGVLGAKRVLLVKRIVPRGGALSAHRLVAKGIVDPLFPKFLAASGAEGFIAGPRDHAAAAAAIRNGTAPGIAIALT